MADVTVERDGNRGDGSNTGVIVAIVAIVLLVLAAIFFLPGLINNTNNTGTGTGVETTAPTVDVPATTAPPTTTE